MALTRSFLNGMGLTADQVSAIIEAHSETVDALKGQRDSYKAEAEKLEKVEKEFTKYKEQHTDSDTDEWKDKFEAEHASFESFKSEVKTKEANTTKANAYKALLKSSGVDEKRIDSIMKLTNVADLKLDKEGNLADAETLSNGIKTEWADFIVSTQKSGADTQKPPANDQRKTYSAADIKGMTAAEINANWDSVKASLQ